MFTNVSIVSPGTCIDIQGKSLVDATFVNCQLQAMSDSAGPGILIGSSGSPNKDIDTVRFVSCVVSGFTGNGLEIQQGQNIQVIGGSYSGNGSDGGAGIAITGAATEVQIDGVSCVGPSEASTLVQQFGIAITAGQDIQITGSDCSGTGSSGFLGTGIAISSGESGTPTGIRIIGTNCVGDVLEESASEQQYGVSVAGASSVYIDGCTLTGSISGGSGVDISGAATDVFVSNCDCSGNPYGISVMGSCKNVYVDGCNLNDCTTAPLNASSPGTLQVINSPGYNDQGTVLAGTPVSNTTFNSTQFGYYGPIAFYVQSAPLATITQIKIDGTITHLTSGGFTLNAPAPDGTSYLGETALIMYGGGGTVFPYFLAVGK